MGSTVQEASYKRDTKHTWFCAAPFFLRRRRLAGLQHRIVHESLRWYLFRTLAVLRHRWFPFGGKIWVFAFQWHGALKRTNEGVDSQDKNRHSLTQR